jgi:catechol 2,3-dioxygenase-like lactoylglutathione lyase family enzyme
MADPQSNPRWRGINHLALITPDMDATVRFYHGVLGMPIVATINAGPMRHYFFDMGAGNTIAFFQWSDADIETFEKPAGIPPSGPFQFDHVSFNLPELRDLELLQARLESMGVEVTELVDHGFVQSVYFTDPNGIALEASYWVKDPTGLPPDFADGEMFGDTDPVPAVREIQETGTVASVPHTGLVDAGADPA